MHRRRLSSGLRRPQARSHGEQSRLINDLWRILNLVSWALWVLGGVFIAFRCGLALLAFTYSLINAPASVVSSTILGQDASIQANRPSGHFQQLEPYIWPLTFNFWSPRARGAFLIFFVTSIPFRNLSFSGFLFVVAALVSILAYSYSLIRTEDVLTVLALIGVAFLGYKVALCRKKLSRVFHSLTLLVGCSLLGTSFNSSYVPIIHFSLVYIAFLARVTKNTVTLAKRTGPQFIGFAIIAITLPLLLRTNLLWAEQVSLLQHLQIHRDTCGWLLFFSVLATFKGLKILVHTVSYYLFTNPAQSPRNPTVTSDDATVIIPTVGPFGNEFIDCVQSVLRNRPARLIISTVGLQKWKEALQVCDEIDPRIRVVYTTAANKRLQFLAAAEMAKTPIIVSADDHVFWPGTFLKSALAPFEDPLVGLVGTAKRVIRNHGLDFWSNIFNYIACIYLERHNFECTASYNIDGGVFVISGRTVLARTSIIQSDDYRHGYQNEYFRGKGPMKVDDDNFNTRYMVNNGFKTVFHNHPDAIITTTLVYEHGQLTKFKGQLMRWARTTFRNNSKSLFTERACYYRHPWTTYAMFISSFLNLALFYDSGLFFTLWMSSGSSYLSTLALILFATKLIKPLPHLLREPRDWKMVPVGILFGYAHSIIRLCAFFTMGNLEWSGRKGIRPTDRMTKLRWAGAQAA